MIKINFFGKKYCVVSEEKLNRICGLIKHAETLTEYLEDGETMIKSGFEYLHDEKNKPDDWHKGYYDGYVSSYEKLMEIAREKHAFVEDSQ